MRTKKYFIVISRTGLFCWLKLMEFHTLLFITLAKRFLSYTLVWLLNLHTSVINLKENKIWQLISSIKYSLFVNVNSTIAMQNLTLEKLGCGLSARAVKKVEFYANKRINQKVYLVNKNRASNIMSIMFSKIAILFFYIN